MKNKIFSFFCLVFFGLVATTSIADPWAALTPANVQRPIALFNSSHHWVTFVLTDDRGNVIIENKAPIIMIPTLLFTKATSMWHHNIHVMVTQHRLFHAARTVDCQPFNGNFSYVQGYTFVAAQDNNGDLICNSVHL